jgi:hypothetical protein
MGGDRHSRNVEWGFDCILFPEFIGFNFLIAVSESAM